MFLRKPKRTQLKDTIRLPFWKDHSGCCVRMDWRSGRVDLGNQISDHINRPGKSEWFLIAGGVSPHLHKTWQTPELEGLQVPDPTCLFPEMGFSHPTNISRSKKKRKCIWRVSIPVTKPTWWKQALIPWNFGWLPSASFKIFYHSDHSQGFSIMKFFSDRDYSIAIYAAITREGSAFPLLTLYFQSHKIYNLLKHGMQS